MVKNGEGESSVLTLERKLILAQSHVRFFCLVTLDINVLLRKIALSSVTVLSSRWPQPTELGPGWEKIGNVKIMIRDLADNYIR